MKKRPEKPSPISEITGSLQDLINSLGNICDQNEKEKTILKALRGLPENVVPDSDDFIDVLNFHLYGHIRKTYVNKNEKSCLWRFYKKIDADQLSGLEKNGLGLLDCLSRIYFYSEPLDDLTCIFIPIGNSDEIDDYLKWIKKYFYNENYPTSLLWLYALDSSLSDYFQDEIIYIGKRLDSDKKNILLPDFSCDDSVLLKRFSGDRKHYTLQQGREANFEFGQIFSNLRKDYHDRCLSNSLKKCDNDFNKNAPEEWEKYKEVLEFGVSDKYENGCISFSDLRNSTGFLNRYGKNFFRNKIQQPFFEETKLISKRFKGRIDKFMGDNVMCVFLNDSDSCENGDEINTILNTFFSLLALCKILTDILEKLKIADSQLGLRSGVSYGLEILRSNLGNELVRDFTVTGETVNLAARLEHFSINELIIHNNEYFREALERFPQICELAEVVREYDHFNSETKMIIENYTLYQNIISNLKRLDKVRFDIRCNNDFFMLLKNHFISRGFTAVNPGNSEIFGYEEYEVQGCLLRFYFSFFNPRGFDKFEKIWILPLNEEILNKLDANSLL